MLYIPTFLIGCGGIGRLMLAYIVSILATLDNGFTRYPQSVQSLELDTTPETGWNLNVPGWTELLHTAGPRHSFVPLPSENPRAIAEVLKQVAAVPERFRILLNIISPDGLATVGTLRTDELGAAQRPMAGTATFVLNFERVVAPALEFSFGQFLALCGQQPGRILILGGGSGATGSSFSDALARILEHMNRERNGGQIEILRSIVAMTPSDQTPNPEHARAIFATLLNDAAVANR